MSQDYTATVDAIGTDSGWAPTGAATGWQAIQSDDGDTSYAESSANGEKLGANVTNPLAGVPVAAINTVTVHAKTKVVGGAPTYDFRYFALLGGVYAYSGGDVMQGVGYVDQPHAVGRPGGGAWTVADFAAAEFGIINDNNNGAKRVSYLYVVVNVEMAAGMMSFDL